MFSLMSLEIIGVLIAVALYRLYRWLLPKPIPGIPYNTAAAKLLLGDAGDMLREVRITGEFGAWCAKQVQKMGAPVCQVFIRPFSQPWVLVADFRESRDILMRRREFGKSKFISDGMACLGDFHGLFPTGARFKFNRQLVQDLMTSSFLNGHAGPAIYAHGLKLLEILEVKRKLACGRPFSVSRDIENTAVDSMLSFAFGENWQASTLSADIRLLSGLDASSLRDGNVLERPVEFPHTELGEFLHVVHEIPKVVEKATVSWSPRFSFWWWGKQAWYKTLFDIKDRAIRGQVKMALHNVHAGRVESAMEHMLLRESSRADKHDVEPDFDSHVFVDEIFGNIIGGHHTTSGAIMWAIKQLTRHPATQSKLRATLYASLPAASREARIPSFSELRTTKIPYLDAVIEEVNRLNAFTVTRHTLVDTQILGHPIPKGTEVFMVSNGPGFLSPHLPVDSTKRTEASRAARLRDCWDESEDLTAFRPERWLATDAEGYTEFDGAAGPQLVFGLGPRACWGRRLAKLEMRIVIALVVWNFELLETPQPLSSYRAYEGIARVPHMCYVRLKRIEGSIQDPNILVSCRQLQ
ncbi:hypothetical protein PG997_008672 [Apiospora hydei]|uniref:Cytochrome P450 n=1 Tax=Apiospora hydei TaxID=1337664 RepID=A0ABR1WFA7_9PEZI